MSLVALTSEQIAANLKSARNLAASNLGLRGANGEEPAGLTYEQRNAYNKELARIIATYPERFGTVAAGVAQGVLAKSYAPLSDQTLGEAVNVFVNEVERQAGRLNQSFNPFSESNTSLTKWLVIGGLVIAAGVWFGPALVAGGRRTRALFR